MAAFSEFIINDDRKADVVLYWDTSCVLDSGELLPIKQIESWCRTCRNVVAGEIVPTIDDIHREIAMLSDPSDKIHGCFGRLTIDNWLANEKLGCNGEPANFALALSRLFLDQYRAYFDRRFCRRRVAHENTSRHWWARINGP